MNRAKKATPDSKSIVVNVSEVAETSKRGGDSQKKDKKLAEMDMSSSDVDSEEDSFSKNMIKIKLNKRKVLVAMDSLEKENKSLKLEMENLKAELEKVKHENDVLREANINLQVEVYDLKQGKSNHTVINESTVEEFIVEEPVKVLKPVGKIIVEETMQPQEYDEMVEVIEEDEYSESMDDSYLSQNPSENPTVESIQKKYKIHLEDHQLEALNEFEPGDKNDSRFLNFLLPLLFDKKTLINSTVTGKPYTNRKNPGEPKSKSRLDPRKMSFIKAMFIHRIRSEDCPLNVKETRIKKFHNLVGNKISNLKLSNKRKSVSKSTKD